MPNYCYTQLEVTGPEDDIARFRNGIRFADNCFHILDSYYPTPADLLDIPAFGGNDDALHAVYDRNLHRHGFRSWYDWRIAHYGSKWPDCDTTLEDESPNRLYFHLSSAWSPLNEGFQHISTMFPTLGFVLSYEDEGGFFVGASAFLGGDVLFHRDDDPKFREQNDNEDESDYWNAQLNHVCALRDQLVDEADNALALARHAERR